MRLPKANTNKLPHPSKRRVGLGIANAEQAQDLTQKLNLVDYQQEFEGYQKDKEGGGTGGVKLGGSIENELSEATGFGCAIFSKESSNSISGNRRQEVLQVGPVVDVGFTYNATVYSHEVEISAAAGDSPTSIASKMAAAINATTAAQWNEHGSVPSPAPAGFKPTATASGNKVTAILNFGNSFAVSARGCNNMQPPPPPPPPPTTPSNQSPVARAGDAITIQQPANSVQLDGSASSDPENGSLAFSWSMVEGPNMPNITGSATAKPTIENLVAGHYTFRLTVFDPVGASSSSTVNVNVVAAGAPPPPTGNDQPPPAGNGDNEPPPPADKDIPGPSANVVTAPVLTQFLGPFGPLGGGGGGAGAPNKNATEQEQAPKKKRNLLLLAFVTLSVTYIVFAPNK